MKGMYKYIILALITSCGPSVLIDEKPLEPTIIKGEKGDKGENGLNGFSTLYSTVPTATSCSNGGYTLIVGVDSNRNSTLDVEDSNVQSLEICNGSNGTNGVDGADGQDGEDGEDAVASPFTPTSIIDPCGNTPAIHDEIFLKLANGTLIASFSDNASGLNTRFSVLVPGNYTTTDGSNCTFTVNGNNDLINEHQ